MKPSLPKGTRDFLPSEMMRRKYIFNTIEKVYQKYGFLPIETPAMERLDTLTGKYGEEGDQLLFKILNNGDFLAKADRQALHDQDSQKALNSLSKRGLRYDLTVPFARFVVMHQNDLSFPFKRYQIQPVWRADRPQKGRYQEFYQCDADVVGSNSLMFEADFIRIFDEVFKKLEVDVTIHLNHRKLLEGMVKEVEATDHFAAITVILDKLDKVGAEEVKAQLGALGLTHQQVEGIFSFMEKDLTGLKDVLKNDTAQEALEELQTVMDLVGKVHNELNFTPTLARGLAYYTGCIFEVSAKDVKMGSIASGGRYADLTSIFGMKDMPGVGISFGAERIYDVLDELNIFSRKLDTKPSILFVAFDDNTWRRAYKIVGEMRANEDVLIELYPEPAKMKKQLKYADQRDFDFVGIIGENELENDSVMLKNLSLGKQHSVPVEELIPEILGEKGSSF